MAACSEVGSPSCVVPYSQARSSRSWRRAIVVIRRGSVVRCSSTSDCSTESCRWAAMRRPLVLADARRPLVVEAPQQTAERRRGEDGQSADDDGDGAGGRADAGQPAGAVGERRHAGDEQDDADDDLRDADPGRRRPSAVPGRRATTRSRCRRRRRLPAP